MANDTMTWTPARPGTKPLAPHRPIRLQICLSADERARLDAQARAEGYESAAAFIRARTIPAPGTATPVPAPGVLPGSASKG